MPNDPTTNAESSTASFDTSAVGTGVANQPENTIGQAQDTNADSDIPEPFHTHPAWQRIITERNAATERAKALETYEPFKPLIDDFTAKGVKSADEFRALMAQQSEQQQQHNAIENQKHLAARALQARVDRGELDQETAEKQWEVEEERIELQLARQQYRMMHLGTELDTLKASYPLFDPNYVKTMVQYTGRSAEEFARQSHSERLAYKNQVIGEYNQSKQADTSANAHTPESGGVNPPVPKGMPDPQQNPKEFDRWIKAQAEETNRLTGRA